MLLTHLLNQLYACARTQNQRAAKNLHAYIIKSGLHHLEPIPNTLINIYSKCSILQDALKVFDEMPQRDIVSWGTILAAHNQANLPRLALSIFPYMLKHDKLIPDHFILATLVKACTESNALTQGKQIHASFLTSQFHDDDVVKSSLVDLYSKCGLPDLAWWVFVSISKPNQRALTNMVSGYARNGRKSEALELFRKMPVKDIYTRTALISGLAQSGNSEDAFFLFIQMRRSSVDIIDPFVFSSIVGVCAHLAAIETGKQIHCLVMGLGFQSCLFISNALVDMYAKCSDISAAKAIFKGMFFRDVISWTSLIVGMAQHGQAVDALGVYDKMVSSGVKPNEVTFVGLIYACSHVGLIEKGRFLFNSMTRDFGISPSLNHYTCFLDLLCRSGQLDEAENVIKIMPFEPDEPTWCAFLSACRRHRNWEMAARVADRLLQTLKPRDIATYILLSHAYAGASMWENVAKVRRMAMEFPKSPGCSSISFGRDCAVFYAGEDVEQPLKGEIRGLLEGVEEEMRKRGYVPDTSELVYDLEEGEKERILVWHSERLAVAYGLLKSVPGTVIRVVKNLRVCGDCHTVLKFVSSIVKRDIVVRDSTRFHHFRDGICSCADFW